MGHRPLRPLQGHLLPNARLGRRLCGVPLSGVDQGRPDPAPSSLRAVSLRRARPAARHRHRLRGGTARRGYSVLLPEIRAGTRRHGVQRHHVPGPVGAPGRWQGVRAHPGPGQRSHQVSRLPRPEGHSRGSRPPRWVDGRPDLRRLSAARWLPASSRHSLGRHGRCPPPAVGGGTDGVGQDGGPLGAPVGQGRLRHDGDRQVRPPCPRRPQRHAPVGRHHRRRSWCRHRPGDDPAGACHLRPADPR